jgi:hypothetical protein
MAAPAAAQYLSISVGTLRGLPIRRKVIPGVRRLVYDRIDLEAYADSLEAEGEEDTCAADEAWGPGD